MKHEIIYERGELFDVNMMITMSIRISGCPSEEEIVRAFSLAVGTNEILLSRIVIDNDGRAFYVDNDHPESFIRKADDSLDAIRQREEKKRFKLEKGEYIRAYYEVEEDRTTILFLMHHMAGDGMSLQYFIEDFMTFLAGEQKSFKEIRTAETGDALDVVSHGIIRHYNRKWNKHVFSFSDMDKAYDAYWKDRTSVIDRKVIEKEEMDKILDECRKAGVRYTAYITAWLIKESQRTMDIGYAMDYRQDKNRSMGNQASGFSIRYRYNSEKSLLDNARAIQKKIDKKIREHEKGSYILSFVAGFVPTLHDAVNLEHAGTFHDKVSFSLARLMGYIGTTKDYSITNLTVADIPVRYGDYEIEEMMFAGPVVSYGKIIFSIVSCNGKTVITKHVRKYCSASETVESTYGNVGAETEKE